MLNRNFRLIDQLTIVDTSGVEHIILATLSSGMVEAAVASGDLPYWFTFYLPEVATLID